MSTALHDPVEQTTADAASLRRALGRFATGVAIVMTEDSDGPHAATINSLTRTSLDPPLVLISLATASKVAEVVMATAEFTVNILGAGQRHIAAHFARPAADQKFEGFEVHRGAYGRPVVPRALAVLECRVADTMELGDHTVFVGRVQHAQHSAGAPLLFHSGRFGEFYNPDEHLDFLMNNTPGLL